VTALDPGRSGRTLREVVLGVAVVLKWLGPELRGSLEARELRDDYQAGRLSVVVPSQFFLEVLNAAERRWRWEAEAVEGLADALSDLSFEIGEPELSSVVSWTSRGLTAYDAAQVALAETRKPVLITDADAIIELAPGIRRALAGGAASAGRGGPAPEASAGAGPFPGRTGQL
jgi:predicted nucleic acid-binding protein